MPSCSRKPRTSTRKRRGASAARTWSAIASKWPRSTSASSRWIGWMIRGLWRSWRRRARSASGPCHYRSVLCHSSPGMSAIPGAVFLVVGQFDSSISEMSSAKNRGAIWRRSAASGLIVDHYKKKESACMSAYAKRNGMAGTEWRSRTAKGSQKTGE